MWKKNLYLSSSNTKMVLRPYGCKIYTCTQFFKNYFHVTETENSPFNSVTALNNIKQQVIQVIILKVLSYSCKSEPVGFHN